ncbi:transglycosylase domain-containing protein [Patescibacteria group bacterium]
MKLIDKIRNRLFPNKDSNLLKRILFWGATSIVALMFLGVISLAALFSILSIGLPPVDDIDSLAAAQSTEIYDRDGNLLYTIHGEENREQIDYQNFSPHLIDATVSIEDDEFWEHGGFDVFAIGKAMMHEFFGIGSKRGGSTITQQYIKNTFLSNERTYTRKAKEIILAIRLERAYSKEEIMGLYLNRIPYGNNAYGAQKASEIYFNKDAKDLTVAESSILAALPQAPSRYSPYGDNRHSHLLKTFTPEELGNRSITSELDLEIDEYARGLIGQWVDLGNGEKVYIPGRTDIVIKRMHNLGYITAVERQKALDELQRLEFQVHKENIEHPHFVLYIKQILEDRYGKEMLEQGGLKVYTTLDPEIQTKAEEIIFEKGQAYPDKFGANNIASLTINSKTGEILSMVGSADYYNEEIDGNVNVVLRPRQPGSSFKPIAYAQAFYNGYGPGNVIYDVPTRFGSGRPQNYDGSWGGQMSVRKGLAQSRNIPAVKAYYLAEEQDAIIELAEEMGITTLDKDHVYGYPLALGAGEVPLIEMVQAFGVFANTGKKPELTGIVRVENSNGDILEEWNPEEFEEVMDPQVAFLINDILSDEELGIGPNLFVNGHTNAAKTGTSTKETKSTAGGSVLPSNALTIGYTPSIVTGVWVGNTDGAGLGYNANGYDAAAPIFKAIMTEALADMPAESFPVPEGIERVSISKASGKRPGENTPEDYIYEEYFASFGVPDEIEEAFFKVEIDKISGLLPNEFTPEACVEEITFQKYEAIADLLNWQEEINSFYEKKLNEVAEESSEEGEEEKEGSSGIRVGAPPTEYDNVHTAETANNKPEITIIDPVSHGSLEAGQHNIEIELIAPNGIDKIEYFFNDSLEFIASTPPYFGFINISPLLEDGSRHLIVAKATDQLCYTNQSAIEIKVGEEDDDKDEKDKDDDKKDKDDKDKKDEDDEEPEPEEPEPEPEPEEPEPEPDPEPDPIPEVIPEPEPVLPPEEPVEEPVETDQTE